MGLRINQNVAAMNSYRNLSVTDGQMSKSLEKLSSGFRINRAADDAAGLAISEKLRGQVNGLNKASENAQNGISLIQTAEGALNETHSILQRVRELTVQASNDTNTGDDRASIQKEVTALTAELNRIAGTTEYNTKSLLGGDDDDSTQPKAFTFQVGANGGADQKITISIGNMGVSGLGLSGLTDLETAGRTAAAGTAQVGTAQVGTAQVGTAQVGTAQVGTAQVGTPESGTFGEPGYVAASSDYAPASSDYVAASSDYVAASSDYAPASSDYVAASSDYAPASSDYAVASDAFDTNLAAIDEAIKTVSGQRAELGAVQNRLEHTVNNLNVASENLAASESRIRDTDMAKEMMAFTRSQILSQAGTAMLAQANQAPQGVLSLLR